MSTKSGNNNLDFRPQTLNKSAVYFISNNIRLIRCVVLIIHGFGGSWSMYCWLVVIGVSVGIPDTINVELIYYNFFPAFLSSVNLRVLFLSSVGNVTVILMVHL